MESISLMGGLASAVGIAIFAIIIWLYVRILHKAGFSGWWVFMLFIPLINFIAIWIFAFAKWPVMQPETKG